MGYGRRGPAEWVKHVVRVRCGGHDTVRCRKLRLLAHRATGGRKIAWSNGRAIGVEKYPTRPVRAIRFNGICCATHEGPAASGGHIHGGDTQSPYGGGVASGLSRRGNGQTATPGIEVQETVRACRLDNHECKARGVGIRTEPF